jgi:hypothetical protein
MGQVLGHLAEVREIANTSKKNFGMGIYLKRKEWYQVTGSRTVELKMLGKPVIISSDPNVYKEVLGPKQDSFTNSVPFKIIFGHFFSTSMTRTRCSSGEAFWPWCLHSQWRWPSGAAVI